MNPLTAATSGVDAAPARAALDLASLHTRIAHSVSTASDESALLAELVELLGTITNAAAVLSWTGEGSTPLRRGPCQISRQILDWVPDVDTRMASEAALAVQDQRLRVTRLEHESPLYACALPTGPGATSTRCLQLVLRLGSQPLEPFLVILQLLGGYVALHAPLVAARRDGDHLDVAAALIELVEALLQSPAGQAPRVLCESLLWHGDTRCVVLVDVDPQGRCRFGAAAGLGEDAARGTIARTAERAASLLVEADGEALEWTYGAADTKGAADFARSLDAQQALVIALRRERDVERRIESVICLSWPAPTPRAAEVQTLIASGGALIAAALASQAAGTPGPVKRAVRWLNAHRARRHAVLGAVAGLLLLLACPVPHRIAADVTLVPAQYRYVSAPFEGVLATTHRKIGDVVRSGEVLAAMDGHDLANELAMIDAELARAAKQRDVALARGDSAAGQLAGFEYQRYAVRRELITRHQQDLSLKSPIDGVIIAGDLEKARGAAVQTGQVLFEIAPLQDLEIEAAIPDEDVQWVSPGQALSYDLDAFRGSDLDVALDRIHPRAEIRNGRNVFVAVARLANTDGALRPGMSGVGHVRIGLRPLGWVLLHKPLAFVARYLAW